MACSENQVASLRATGMFTWRWGDQCNLTIHDYSPGVLIVWYCMIVGHAKNGGDLSLVNPSYCNATCWKPHLFSRQEDDCFPDISCLLSKACIRWWLPFPGDKIWVIWPNSAFSAFWMPQCSNQAKDGGRGLPEKQNVVEKHQKPIQAHLQPMIADSDECCSLSPGIHHVQ